jgi:hypothetical protein
MLERKSVTNIYGHNNGRFSGGVGLSCHVEILNHLNGFNLDHITETGTASVYRLKYDGRMIKPEFKGVIK